MKLRILLVALVVGALSASVALAGPTTEAEPASDEATAVEKESKKPKSDKKAKPSGKKESSSCRTRMYVLKGILESIDGDSVAMYVRGGNHRGKAYVGEMLEVMIGEATKIRHKGLDDPRAQRAELADFEVGDRVKVQIRRCKGTTEGLMYAKRLKGRTPPPDAAAEEKAETSEATESETPKVEDSETPA